MNENIILNMVLEKPTDWKQFRSYQPKICVGWINKDVYSDTPVRTLLCKVSWDPVYISSLLTCYRGILSGRWVGGWGSKKKFLMRIVLHVFTDERQRKTRIKGIEMREDFLEIIVRARQAKRKISIFVWLYVVN